jgi:hypothetical protein
MISFKRYGNFLNEGCVWSASGAYDMAEMEPSIRSKKGCGFDSNCQKYVPIGMAFFLSFVGAGFIPARSG